jgi:hypothetical protein
MEFAPASWSDLERTSFTEGLDDLMANQEERVAEEERQKAEEVRQVALRRALQRAKARKWEQEQMEKNRARELELRVEQARRLAQDQANDMLAERRAELDHALENQIVEDGWEQELTVAKVQQSKRRYGLLAQSTLAAAAVGVVVWVSALSQARTMTGDQLAAQRDLAADHEFAAQTRVAELRGEIERRVSMTGDEKRLLEDQLRSAEQRLAEAEQEREAIDLRQPKRQAPKRLAKKIVPLKKAPAKVDADSAPSAVTDDVRVATDEPVMEECLPYDPLCFKL